MSALRGTWSTEQDHELRKLILAGSRGVDIAIKMGMTRNAILGRAHRLGLSVGVKPEAKQVETAAPPAIAILAPEQSVKRPSIPRNPKKKAPLAAMGRPVLPVAVAPAPDEPPLVVGLSAFDPVPGVRLIPILDLKIDSCRWPFDCDDGTRYCGRHASQGPYCAGHTLRSVGPGQHNVRAPFSPKPSGRGFSFKEATDA